MKICILGSGTAGLVTALILKQNYPQSEIDLIYSSKIGIIGVGEGSTEHWKRFMNFVGITNQDLVKHCGATYKTGIMFQDWTDDPYLHSIEGNYTHKYLERLITYEYLISQKVKPLDFTISLSHKNRIAINNLDEIIENPAISQYHFDTYKLNDFLFNLAKDRGINTYEDEIGQVELDDNGYVKQLVGSKVYKSDFYIDCSGLKRTIIGKLDPLWQTFSDHLKVNKAIMFATENLDYPIWTSAKAMDAGWMFTIPTYDRKGNGYIFDNNILSDEDAQHEVETELGHEIEIKKSIHFEPGCLKNPWIKNCVAIGLSANFVEPLEATSIGTSIQQAFLLASHLHGYCDTSIQKYNKIVYDIMINIRDFIFLHYMNKRSDTVFWKKINSIDPPVTLERILDISRCRTLIDSDINQTGYELFGSANFLIVLYANKMIDEKMIQKQFLNLPKDVIDFVIQDYTELQQVLKSSKNISHKCALDLIKNIS